MALDSYKIRETKKVEEVKKDNPFEGIASLKSLIASLPMDKTKVNTNSDIDQKWIKENESKETRNMFSNHHSEPQSKPEEINIQTSKVSPKPTEESVTETLTFASSPVNEVKVNINSAITPEPIEKMASETPAPSTIPELPALKEVLEINNQELITQLNANIDKKHQFLNNQLASIYNSSLLEQDVQAIYTDLHNIMDIKDRSLEELRKVDNGLNTLISRFAKLSQKAEEIKATDDFQINEQNTLNQELQNYQGGLTSKYGEFWFAQMTKEEERTYINLYCRAHNVSRESVKKDIDDSIAKAYDEIREREKKISQPVPPVFKGESEETIKFNGRLALNTLKQIYSQLIQATPEQVQEFNILYQELSALSKSQPTSLEEEQQKLTKLFDLTDKINALANNLESVSQHR